jgi:acyl carrier protein
VEVARRRFGPIHGVIHAAGVAGGGMAQLRSPAAASRVLAPKVRGTRVLAAALAGEEELDFVLLCASVTGVLGGFGQIDYCAANAFLDAYARRSATRRGTFWAAIDWDRWQGVGMAAMAAMPAPPVAAAATAGAGAAPGAGSPVGTEMLGGPGALPGSAAPVAPAQLGALAVPVAASERLHPLLDRCLAMGPRRAVFATELDVAGRWILGEHRILGRPTVPGTAYLEMARAAFEVMAGAGPVEIREAVFLAPLAVDDGQRAGVLTILERDGEVWSFRVASEGAGGGALREHARGRIGRLAGVSLGPAATPADTPADIAADAAPAVAPHRDLQAIRARCGGELGEVLAAQGRRLAGFLATGPRWQSLRAMTAGEGESLATLELPAELAGDLAFHALHPALLDVAAGSVQLLAVGNYLPLAYEALRLYAPLPSRLHSHARYRRDPAGAVGAASAVGLAGAARTVGAAVTAGAAGTIGGASAVGVPGAARTVGAADVDGATDTAGTAVKAGATGGDTLTCDLTLLDAAGAVVAEISGFSMKRIGAEAAQQLSGAVPSHSVTVASSDPGLAAAGSGSFAGSSAAPSPPAGTVGAFAALAALGGAAAGSISAHEGAEVLCRVLGGRLHQVVVSTVDLQAARRRVAGVDGDRIAAALGALGTPAMAPARREVKTLFIAPGNDLERQIAAVWQRVLGIEQIGSHDNFFELGGTSLSGVQLVAELKKTLGVEIPSVTIFEAPTVAALARHLAPRSAGPAFEHSQERARRKQEVLDRQRELAQGRLRGSRAAS